MFAIGVAFAGKSIYGPNREGVLSAYPRSIDSSHGLLSNEIFLAVRHRRSDALLGITFDELRRYCFRVGGILAGGWDWNIYLLRILESLKLL